MTTALLMILVSSVAVRVVAAMDLFGFINKAIISLFLVSRHCPHQFLGCLTKF